MVKQRLYQKYKKKKIGRHGGAHLWSQLLRRLRWEDLLSLVGQRLQWAEIAPLLSSLGDRVRPNLQKNKERKKCIQGTTIVKAWGGSPQNTSIASTIKTEMKTLMWLPSPSVDNSPFLSVPFYSKNGLELALTTLPTSVLFFPLQTLVRCGHHGATERSPATSVLSNLQDNSHFLSYQHQTWWRIPFLDLPSWASHCPGFPAALLVALS